MENNLLIVGAGIYAAVAKEVAESMACFEKIDYIDDNAKIASDGTVVIGTVKDLADLSRDYRSCVVAIGNPDVRLSLIEKIERETDFRIVTLISPRAYVAPSAQIGKGCVIEPMAVVHSLCKLGIGCLVSAGAVINHASVLGDGCHADCNSTVMGNKNVPDKTKICSGEVFGKKYDTDHACPC